MQLCKVKIYSHLFCQKRQLKNENMNLLKLLVAISIVPTVFIVGCKKDGAKPIASKTIIVPVQTTVQTTVQAPVALGVASQFSILAGSSITNTGVTDISGDIGLSPGTSIGGFPPGVLSGTIHINNDIATQAKLDIVTAYDNLVARVATDIVTLSGNIGGLTLTPGLYKSTSSLAISSGDLTFNAMGNQDAVFIIQIASSLTTTPGRKVILTGGAQASNIFWQVSSSATFGTTTSFKGTIIALESITFDTGAELYGRALTRVGAVTMDANTFVIQ